MQAPQSGSSPLEDRLRNLILANGDGGLAQSIQPPGVSTSVATKAPQETQPAGQRRSMDTASPPTQQPSKGGKKRPNQAQRRQMNAQLSIPVDTRAPAYPSTRTNMHPQQYGRNNQPPNMFRHQPKTNSADHQQYHPGGFSQTPVTSSTHQPNGRRQQHHSFDGFSKGVNVVSAEAFPSRGRAYPARPALYNPGGYRQFSFTPEQLANQSELLEQLCHMVVADAEIELSEIGEKENFRKHVEAICQRVISRHEIELNGAPDFHPQTVQLQCFGSLSAGFATKAADMDLGLLSPMSQMSPDSSDSPIPRLVEGALLDAGFGARLLTRTRVPIIKLCESPNEQLRQHLLAARVRWEKGIKDEDHDVEDGVLDDQETAANAVSPLDAGPQLSLMGSQRRGSHQLVNSKVDTTYEEKLSSLRQSNNQSLVGYYGNAKKLLRQLNGRDITYSNASEFKESDLKILDDVAHAFISGLRDVALKSRIHAYPSFHASVTPQLPNFRSLLGAYTMVEGEKLVLLWETRTLTETNPSIEQGSTKVVQSWNELQHRRAFGADPLLFNKELHLAVERLRLIPSIQLMQLRQDQYEPPAQYHERAVKIATDLRVTGTALPDSNTDVLPQVIECYISGIRDSSVRDHVRTFANSSDARSLRTIARKHKSIHLAADYERALEKALYHEGDVPLIRDYITILRRGLVQVQPRVGNYLDSVIPITESALAVYRKIQQLPNPSGLTPNQPRDRYHDSLEFPKNGIGVQCDINFSAHLALQNTLLLRCYSYTDSRVRPLVLFVKHWAKARGINTPYRGTLSSYGYVLMMLHYLVNIAEPFVCPNLQQLAPPYPDLPGGALEGVTTCKGRNVRFWRDEQEIRRLAEEGRLNQNRESLGSLLRGFFEYYAQNNLMSTTQKRGFDWGRDVLSIRTQGGLLSKQEKGWTGAKTVMQLQSGAPSAPIEVEVAGPQSPQAGNMGGPHATPQAQPQQPMSPDEAAPAPTEQPAKPKEFKEVRHRYLFAVEDPFELEHNVARTVTHNGIVAIRDEFRRAFRIIRAAGNKAQLPEDLLEDVKVHREFVAQKEFAELLEEIHGQDILPDSILEE